MCAPAPPMRLAILIPTMGRPQRIAPLLASIEASVNEPVRTLFIVHPDDETQRAAIAEAGGEVIGCSGGYGECINVGVRATSEPYLFLGADDLRFHPGWLPIAMSRMTETIGVVGTNDLGNGGVLAGTHSTHSLVARWYAELGTIDDPTRLLHEGYDHNYVDTEFICTAQARRAFAPALDSVVEHLHYLFGKAADDHVYVRGRQYAERDRELFGRRSKLWAALRR